MCVHMPVVVVVEDTVTTGSATQHMEHAQLHRLQVVQTQLPVLCTITDIAAVEIFAGRSLHNVVAGGASS